MADEIVNPPQDVETQDPPQDPVVEETHPLEPGGERFKKVYADFRQAQREAAELRGRLSALEAQQAAQREAQQPKRVYSAQELQALVNRGQVDPLVATHQLAWQEAQAAKEAMKAELRAEQVQRDALSEVNQYLDRVPGLNDSSSEDFRRLSRTAQEIAEELRLDVRDVRVQRRALRETFGTLERLAGARQNAEVNRGSAAYSGETARAGSGFSAPAASKEERELAALLRPLDPERRAMYREHWKKLGYTPEQMVKEAKYIKPLRSR